MTRKHHGFTLVELLMVITIIGILTGVSVTVVRQAYHTARVSKTNVTIAKIDRVIMDMYADYENRRVASPNFSGSPEAATVTQAARLWFLRDMIRMEMPCYKEEIEKPPAEFSFQYLNQAGTPQTTGFVSVPPPPLRSLYLREIQKSNGNYEPAKCLYLVVMYGNPEVRELFTDGEIATDDDGLSYFVDGWGNPIYFLRWAPGFALSERQPNPDDVDKAERHPDPLDPTEVGGTVLPTSNFANGQWVIDLVTPQHGWTLLPVIMSSGGVRDYDNFDDNFGMILSPPGDVPAVDPFNFNWQIGAYDPNLNANHAVIHNHRARR